MELSLSFFEPLQGQSFEARLDISITPEPLKLEEVKALPLRETKKPEIRKEPFSLIFSGSPSFARRIVRLNLPEKEETLQLYLEPMGIEDGVMEFEALVG